MAPVEALDRLDDPLVVDWPLSCVPVPLPSVLPPCPKRVESLVSCELIDCPDEDPAPLEEPCREERSERHLLKSSENFW